MSERNTSPPTTSQPTEPMVRLVDLHKSFGKLNVLRGLSLDIHPGQVTVILGPSGTGKSVLLKHVVGLLKPDRGQVWFDGKRIDTMNERELVPVRTQVGYLFQMGALFDSLTVEQNVTFPLREHSDLSEAQMHERCLRVLRIVGLEGVEQKMPSDVSGGQRKRVALARAIVMEPSLVLYDEPTTGLDPIRADVINELILALSKRMGITGIVVTHDMASAHKIADRLIMLYDGRIVADGSPEDFDNTDNDLVRRFVQGQADKEDLDQIERGFAAESAKRVGSGSENP